MDTDVVIAGAGPAGLSMARALSGHGLHITVVDPQDAVALSDPAFDGREIALSQRSVAFLRTLGLWDRIEAHAQSPLRDARVMDGASSFAMVIGQELSAHPELGWLVSNHLIRKAAWQAVRDAALTHADIDIVAGEKVTRIEPEAHCTRVRLSRGRQLRARLVLAADSRFSPTRAMMGIASRMDDFGKTMLVCSMTHEQPHYHAAWEWFDYGQTLALLPMNPEPVSQAWQSSVVVTVRAPEAARLLAMDEDAFNADMSRRFRRRLGAMRLSSTRHAYPLVGVYPDRLVAPRFAAIGDAAVGMHPVTAYGFNFGLLGVQTLSTAVLAAHAAGQDVAAPQLLGRYERTHQRATLPLYLMTRLLVDLYTRESPAARLARKAVLHLGERLTPIKRGIAGSLAGAPG
jgi:ubiquinone biosynthesis UbiH/UbiF/VisC/COQ6 family hydroxylase